LINVTRTDNICFCNSEIINDVSTFKHIPAAVAATVWYRD